VESLGLVKARETLEKDLIEKSPELLTYPGGKLSAFFSNRRLGNPKPEA